MEAEKLNNNRVKHLLGETEEDINEIEIVDPREIRDILWDRTSVTEDMRNLNAQRVLDEIREKFSQAANEIFTPHEYRSREEEVEKMLQRSRDMMEHYKEHRILQDYEVRAEKSLTSDRYRIVAKITRVTPVETVRIGIRID